MSGQPYLGVAGILSTDNAQADQSQIDCEMHDPDEFSQEDPYGEYFEEEFQHFVSCASPEDLSNPWYELGWCTESDLGSFTKTMQKAHDAKCECGNPIQFG